MLEIPMPFKPNKILRRSLLSVSFQREGERERERERERESFRWKQNFRNQTAYERLV